ncbi:hypothetical protein [Collimonas arenae]|uniref:hypothetical protein n=1 Tax=Collimonas arenae TaxID=279058 RepID=UPI00056EB2E4|nr:hypothetical protein [Collimonas arenae]
MLGKLFGTKQKAKPFQVANASMEFFGEPSGPGLSELRIEMTSRLLRFPIVKNAYLTRLKHQGEDVIRIGLAIDTDAATADQMQEIANSCAGFLPMDILFLDSLDVEISTRLRSQCRPLLFSSLSLFECPIVVSKGVNVEMPESWESAVICMYVASPDIENALLTAVQIIRENGYEFKAVHDGKVHLIDAQSWWNGFVLETWPNHSSYFPSQERIMALVATGGHFKGPILEWKTCRSG